MTTDFVLQVPVISTAHLPNAEAVDEVEDLLYAPYVYGWFVYMEDELDPDMPKWYSDVWAWAKHPARNYSWVRFDSDGDCIEQLEDYLW